MLIPRKENHTAEEYFAFTPEDNGERYELINGEFVALAAPSLLHQRISRELVSHINSYIKGNKGKCEVLSAPFDVLIDRYHVVQPDVLVVCAPNKLDDKRCNGAPDFVIEVTSSDRTKDFTYKLAIYREAGVREYWIVDPDHKKTLVYFFDNSDFPDIFTFDTSIPVGIYGGQLSICIAELLK